MRTAMVHQLYQLEKYPKKCLVSHKNDRKTQQYNSGESSKLEYKAWTSVLKISVDRRYCLGDIGGFWLSKGQMRGGSQNFKNYKDNSLIEIMSLNMHSPSANPDSVPSADLHAKTMADRILYRKSVGG